MTAYLSGRRWYSKQRVADGAAGRRTYQLAAGLDEAGAEARDALLTELAAGLRAVTTPAPLDPERTIDPILAKLAQAEGAEAERIEAYIRSRLLPGRRRVVAEVPTVRQFAQLWTLGELASRYPGQVAPRKWAHKDEADLERYVCSVIGDELVSALRLEHVERVLRAMPATMATSTKGKILDTLHRLLDLAVYPAKLLAANPMPRKGFKPPARRPAFVYLYPAEEAALLGCRLVPLSRRLAYGLAARLGLRIGEACGLTWADVDLTLGALRLVEHKTAQHTGARVVPLDAASVAVLARWRERCAEAGGGGDADRVFGWGEWLGKYVLPDVRLAGIGRRELHTSTASSRRFSFHGFRRGFVTLSLGDGRTEDWVMRRTGHTTSKQLGKYRVAAATAAEFKLGWLRAFDEALEWGEAAAEALGEGGVADSPEAESVRGGQETSGEGRLGRVGRRLHLFTPTPEAGQKDRKNEPFEASNEAAREGSGQPADRPDARPRRPLRRVGVSARRRAASGLLTARLERAAEVQS